MEKTKSDLVLERLYLFLLAFALFTGFGNMPIYKRYYISDIPGLGWAGNFYLNLSVHYIVGSLLLGLGIYFAVIYLKTRASKKRLTATGALRVTVIALLLLSGILLAVRNLGTIHFAFAPQITVTFIHLGMAIILLILSIGCNIAKRPWTRRP